jgi:exopolyphosphatase / guanosine-5'-triphosphate,3'-diphosphate pyrophosphatase
MLLSAEDRYNREEEILAFLKTYDQAPTHPTQVARLSKLLFKQLYKMLKINKEYGKYLYWGALLHDIGFSLDVSNHHKNSYKLITNNNFKYFSLREKGIIAAIARYHRKSFPNERHKSYRDLSKIDKKLVQKLSSILRVADGLDRSHSDSVQEIEVRIKKTKIEIKINSSMINKTDIFGGNKKTDLLKEITKKEIVVSKK